MLSKKLFFVLAAAAVGCVAMTSQAAVRLDDPSIELTVEEYPAAVLTLIKRRQYDRAYSYIRDGLKLSPNNVNLKFLKTVALERDGRMTEAVEALEQLIRQYPEIPEPYNNLARIYTEQGRLADAEELLKSAIGLRQNYAVAHENLARLYLIKARNALNEAQKHGLKEGKKLDLLHELLQ